MTFLDSKEKILIAFDSTSDAIAMETYCDSISLKGRLIPLPKEISAGCGIAWISPIALEKEVLNVLENKKFKYSSINKISL